MHWADILSAIQKAGMSVRLIAEQEAVSQPTVSMVIRGTRKSHRVAYAIAAATGIPTETMWPGQYLSAPNYKLARKEHSRGRLPKAQEVANG